MQIQAEISLYALGVADLAPSIYQFLQVLERPGLTVEIGRMSTLIAGEDDLVFAALREAYGAAAAQGQRVLVAKIMNPRV